MAVRSQDGTKTCRKNSYCSLSTQQGVASGTMLSLGWTGCVFFFCVSSVVRPYLDHQTSHPGEVGRPSPHVRRRDFTHGGNDGHKGPDGEPQIIEGKVRKWLFRPHGPDRGSCQGKDCSFLSRSDLKDKDSPINLSWPQTRNTPFLYFSLSFFFSWHWFSHTQ